MPNFSYRFIKPATGKLNKGSLQAFDEAHLRDLLARAGVTDVRDVVAAQPRPATERQIDYLRDLGVLAPADCTIDEASDLIDNRKRHRVPAGAYEQGLAAFYKVEVTRYASKSAIYDSIAAALSSKASLEDLVGWYVFRVYRAGIDRPRQSAADIATPDHATLRAISKSLALREDVVRSILREREFADGWRWFGQYTAPDGQTHQGASRATLAYKAVCAALQAAGLVKEPAVAQSIPRERVSRWKDAAEELRTVRCSWWRRLFGL